MVWQFLMSMGLLFAILFMAIPVLVFAFWIWMLVDCVQRKFKDKNDKIVWILVIIFAHVIGATIYYILVKRKD